MTELTLGHGAIIEKKLPVSELVIYDIQRIVKLVLFEYLDQALKYVFPVGGIF